MFTVLSMFGKNNNLPVTRMLKFLVLIFNLLIGILSSDFPKIQIFKPLYYLMVLMKLHLLYFGLYSTPYSHVPI